jgi:hypothetical protein
MKPDLVELRKQAERAVQDMRDGDLKLKAFETILAHLLAGGVARADAPTERKSTPVRKPQATGGKPPKSATDRILTIKAERFFASQRSIAEIRQELKKNGWHYPVTSLSGPLQTLVSNRTLRREKVKDGKGRKGWKYSNS